MTLRNQRGQMVIEGLLLMIVIVSIFLVLMRNLQESNLIPGLVTGPWDKIAGMTESGNWNPQSEAQRKHPNNFDRFFTPRSY